MLNSNADANPIVWKHKIEAGLRLGFAYVISSKLGYKPHIQELRPYLLENTGIDFI